jgi:pyridoxamine 5'-phosphate oxidase
MGASDDLGQAGSVREWLRGLEVFAGPLADFDPAGAPAEPVELFLGWLTEAVEAGVPDAHAMTLSTVGEDGGPDARVLILKNVDADGWQFAVHAGSPKGRQLADLPRAALTFYWPLQGRQVRVRGTVEPASPSRVPPICWPVRPPPAPRRCWAGRAAIWRAPESATAPSARRWPGSSRTPP